ncbi:hypothetical protein J3Q64DRAFT_1835716 [Phycomyces blakesleeanus]|uniref:2,4-dienoyl-CoA reductase [(3E)-enoyl-CoA-producing] n=2 Tax=Phycomyces blakesleeanus TaxID=4837 RepID=A0A167MAA2_PHYB8|nr:hypothetical protein PHYBLDRAFT_146467 [Phycomyces blakesleeanus NRRL 1555(-)]OAD72264.1 hypothetical protein PHYBLDRAFT_146467 [Phycomyces blakesleeanus NRRL 1555(-)]|eukprot:XP_018290304.1 hypothetical protein PHYBLDRAFT_146467 [Phycomyces blakesleeanus NRRL 1555(-)]
MYSATLHYTGVPYQQHPGAAKAGIDALTKLWAVELGPHDVRVNGIASGPIMVLGSLDILIHTPR